jgi:LDH2 family malate/lactate/ureidoglycolate dehydrogenase
MAIIIDHKNLRTFTEKIPRFFGVSQEAAHLCADNFVAADLRGVSSHGAALIRRYVDGIQIGTILPQAKPEIIRESPSTATIDGHLGLGQVVGSFATSVAIAKAKQTGVGIATARNSNHYGMAGYYAQMMVDEGLLGMSLTNAAPHVIPTFGRIPVIGTNPISLAAPANRHYPFLLDMATSVVPRNKLDKYAHTGMPMPAGWALDAQGRVTTDAAAVLTSMVSRLGGGILPLGGQGELCGGHKGYGLGVFVDILCGVLSGGAYADLVQNVKDGESIIATQVCHFFMALKIENFVDMDTFTAGMDDLIDRLKNSEKAAGQTTIYVHGEKEYERCAKHEKDGIPLPDHVYEILESISNETGIPLDV